MSEEELLKIVEQRDEVIRDLRAIVARLKEDSESAQKILGVVLGSAEPTMLESVKKVSVCFSHQRQHVLWCTEERSKLGRRVKMLEAGLEACILDLRISRAANGIQQHYERLLRNDFEWVMEKRNES